MELRGSWRVPGKAEKRSQESEDTRAIHGACVRIFLEVSKSEDEAGQKSCLTFSHLFLLFLDMFWLLCLPKSAKYWY